MKGKKFFIYLLAATVAAGAFTACGGGGSQPSSSGASAQSAASGEGGGSYVNATGLPIVNEPVKVRMMINKNVSDLGNSWMEKECVQRAVEETGIQFEFIEISAAAWAEQIGVTLAGGDLPDVIVGSFNNFAAYTESFLPLNDLIDTYAPSVNAFYEAYPQLKVAGTLEDGKLYSLPLFQQNGYYSHSNRYAINQQWLDKVGMEVPTTADELYNVLKAFKEQDANGNGDPDDELPYSFQGNTAIALDANSYGLNYLMNCFGIHSGNYVQVDGGTVSFAPTRVEYRQFLEFANRLYSEGLLDPDGFVQQTADFIAKGKAGRVGIVPHHSYLDIVVGADKMDQYTPILPTKDAKGDINITGRSIDGDWNYDCYKIAKTSKHSEALIRLYDYILASDELTTLWSWGPEGKVYTVDSQGVKHRATEFEEGITSFAQARQTYGTGMSGFWIWTAEQAATFEKQPREELMDSFEALYKPYLAEAMPLGVNSQEVVDRRADQFTEINTYIQNFTAEAIMKGVTDASWENHLATCEKLNVTQYTEDYQNFYNAKSID